MKRLISLLAVASLLPLLTSCTTIAPTNPGTVTPAQAAQITADTEAAAAIAIAFDPALATILPEVGKILPTAFANGPINPAAFTNAVATIHGLTPKQVQEIAAVGAVLDLGLTTYEGLSGKTVALYTDPNVATIVNAVASGLSAPSAAAVRRLLTSVPARTVITTPTYTLN